MDNFGLDERLLIWINQDWANPLLDGWFLWLSSKATFSIPLLIIVILVIGFRYHRQGWLLGGLLLLAIAISDALGNFLKDVFQQARPCLELYAYIRNPDGGTSQCASSISGMPSNHAMNFFTLFALLSYFFPRRSVIINSGIVACLVGISRIYLGEHYPSQVLAGATFGLILGTLLALLFKTKIGKLQGE